MAKTHSFVVTGPKRDAGRLRPSGGCQPKAVSVIASGIVTRMGGDGLFFRLRALSRLVPSSKGPRPNSRVTSRQIGYPRDAGPKLSPEAFETATRDPGIKDGVFRIAVPKVILDEPQIVAAIVEVEAA